MTSRIEGMSPDEGREAIRTLLTELTRSIDFAIHALVSGEGVGNSKHLEEWEEVVRTIVMIAQGVGVSIHSIVKLTDTLDMGIRDCFGIARSASEGSINVAYILASGPQMALRARLHAMQKGYRELCKETIVAGRVIGRAGVQAPEDIPGMVEALEMFTRRNGKEVSDWALHSIVEKQKIIMERFPAVEIAMSASTEGLYRNASEVLHGTYYGVQYFWTGGFTTQDVRKDFRRYWVDNHFVAITTSVWASALAMLEVIGAEFDIPEISKLQRRWLMMASDLFVPVQ